MKKAQSISINTIIVAAIAMIVMVLVVMIFTTNITKFNRGTDSCLSNRGTCISSDDVEEKCSGENNVVMDYACYKVNGDKDSTKVCCLKA